MESNPKSNDKSLCTHDFILVRCRRNQPHFATSTRACAEKTKEGSGRGIESLLHASRARGDKGLRGREGIAGGGRLLDEAARPAVASAWRMRLGTRQILKRLRRARSERCLRPQKPPTSGNLGNVGTPSVPLQTTTKAVSRKTSPNFQSGRTSWKHTGARKHGCEKMLADPEFLATVEAAAKEAISKRVCAPISVVVSRLVS